MGKLLTASQRKFCEAYALEKNGTAAYLAAYPNSSAAAANSSAPVLLAIPRISAEIARIRAQAASMPGSAVLTLSEKRNDLAAILRAEKGLFRKSQVRTSDRLKAIEIDNELSGDSAGNNTAPLIVVVIGGSDART